MKSTHSEIEPLSQAMIELTQDQINAGFVFAAAAQEFLMSDPSRANMCLSESEDCLAMAVESVGRLGLAGDQHQELESALADLRKRLDLLRHAGPRASVAA